MKLGSQYWVAKQSLSREGESGGGERKLHFQKGAEGRFRKKRKNSFSSSLSTQDQEVGITHKKIEINKQKN